MPKLLIAASGTGGHLFPALAVAQALTDYEITWLGVPDRLENELIPGHFPLITIKMGGFQSRNPLSKVKPIVQLLKAIRQTRKIVKTGNYVGVFTTGGYISSPAILAARSLGLPAILHDSNALPGKVTRWLTPWCSTVAVGMDEAAKRLKQGQSKTPIKITGTPVRPEFLYRTTNSMSLQIEDVKIPEDVTLIVAMGGSQGAVGLNQLVRGAVRAWLQRGAWVVHLTGSNDPEAQAIQHPHYLSLQFYHDMAPLLQRANLAISRSGASALTELAITATPSILIPYPFAAEDHQWFNAQVFAQAGAAYTHRQQELTSAQLQEIVLDLLKHPAKLEKMSSQAQSLAVPDSVDQLVSLIRSQCT
ncbi:undecaprenyldiphospho-muramoylpentapeptide beta-N-acetylglucosaminyltransferase [Thermosynechococcaceae cyanobacterium BACA0444]|uniref:UDP-N-acetylglucosamine--N-acetylmuramyl-(pentapeptide) pyrophosphoryl-undecaprenol N-acetylglucosamine transferase n=1 Tax=Pseudocalidococcus azoricus BACA0444 TaxID=2918990 RepID=A0AAE4FUF6_9CYAN|nr:undecaprenyldiphospho-muramoylpentapeptide beta-N-acetylglucosaminyltransferase [Pseudocalidococcus azoricus]MDS3861407.1 undecaprenyldiphospho-muramoylpentapeptide beta-N-acetylglucosaminyltransferase [Pseudocalidococcus azoricus BACA0444]